MPSYSYLCRKAGLPAPSGFASFNTRRPEPEAKSTHAADIVDLGRAAVGKALTKKAREKAWLKVELEKMVRDGILYVTADGRYGLTEWLTQKKP